MSEPASARLIVERDMAAPESLAFADGTLIEFSTRCPGASGANEDAAGSIDLGGGCGVLALADGLGGQPAGARASRVAVETVLSAVGAAAAVQGHLREAILNGFETANERIRGMGVGAGTTLAVVELRGAAARTYHVGDSEILVVGQRGRVRLQTVSHSPTGYGVHAGLIDQREALGHQERHLLSNLVGSAEMRIEIGPVLQLRPRDVVLLGSDGLFDNVHVEEIVETVRRGRLLRGGTALARHGAERMAGTQPEQPSKPDDLTFLLFRRSAR